jgi:hypothetical protein
MMGWDREISTAQFAEQMTQITPRPLASHKRQQGSSSSATNLADFFGGFFFGGFLGRLGSCWFFYLCVPGG